MPVLAPDISTAGPEATARRSRHDQSACLERELSHTLAGRQVKVSPGCPLPTR